MRPEQGFRHFAHRRFAPGPPVDRFVENYWSVRWDRTGRPPYRQELIPHPCFNMSVESGWPGEVRHGFAMPAALLHGLVTRRFAIDLAGTGRVLGVRFRPGGFAALTGRSAGGFRDRVVPLAQVVGAAADVLADRVLAEQDDQRRVALIEAFLAERLPDTTPGYDLVLAIATEMLEDHSLIRVAQVTRRHGVSERTLQRLFRHYVGASPKWVLGRHRLHDAAERLEREPGVPIAAVATAAGYFDQAHFCHEFKALLDVTPAEYAAQCRDAHAGER
jgi:AraC-like DNA-binding protein